MKELLKRPYVFWMMGIFLVYISLNVWLSKFYEILFQIPYFLDTIKWTELLISFLLAGIIGVLIAINMTFLLKEYKRRKKLLKKQSFFSSLGIIGGISTGVCSACIAGFVPILFSLVGISFSWAFLPWNGIEVQLLSIVFLTTSLFLLTKKKSSCEVGI